MAKKVKNLLKKLGSIYMKGTMEIYRPIIESGISPFI